MSINATMTFYTISHTPIPFVLVFTGTHCEVDNINACSSGPCMNNASCENTIAFPNGFKCYCNDIGDTVYTGDRCQTSTDVCRVPANACMNDGTCVPIASFRRQCDCRPGYTGDKCETDIGRIDVMASYGWLALYSWESHFKFSFKPFKVRVEISPKHMSAIILE